MSKDRFSFQNQEIFQSCKERRYSLSEKSIKRLIIFSSFSVFFIFSALKSWQWIEGEISSFLSSRKPASLNKFGSEIHVFPLLVNLKGEQGPQLARVYVHIGLIENSKGKQFLYQNSQIEKQILFLLSGQPAVALNTEKDRFEKQIRFQLNAFLSKNFINRVHIQTEMLN